MMAEALSGELSFTRTGLVTDKSFFDTWYTLKGTIEMTRLSVYASVHYSTSPSCLHNSYIFHLIDKNFIHCMLFWIFDEGTAVADSILVLQIPAASFIQLTWTQQNVSSIWRCACDIEFSVVLLLTVMALFSMPLPSKGVLIWYLWCSCLWSKCWVAVLRSVSQ